MTREKEQVVSKKRKKNNSLEVWITYFDTFSSLYCYSFCVSVSRHPGASQFSMIVDFSSRKRDSETRHYMTKNIARNIQMQIKCSLRETRVETENRDADESDLDSLFSGR